MLRLLESLDIFGENFPITYKKKETYQTKLGGVCSLLVKTLTLVMLVVLLKSMVLMEDPEIVSFSRPLKTSEKDDLGNLNFQDEGVIFGMMTSINGKPSDIPPAVGTIIAKNGRVTKIESDENFGYEWASSNLELKSCK